MSFDYSAAKEIVECATFPIDNGVSCHNLIVDATANNRRLKKNPVLFVLYAEHLLIRLIAQRFLLPFVQKPSTRFPLLTDWFAMEETEFLGREFVLFRPIPQAEQDLVCPQIYFSKPSPNYIQGTESITSLFTSLGDVLHICLALLDDLDEDDRSLIEWFLTVPGIQLSVGWSNLGDRTKKRPPAEWYMSALEKLDYKDHISPALMDALHFYSPPRTPPAEDVCAVCYVNAVQTRCLPCQHAVACLECSQQLRSTPNARRCIMCRSRIDEIIQL